MKTNPETVASKKPHNVGEPSFDILGKKDQPTVTYYRHPDGKFREEMPDRNEKEIDDLFSLEGKTAVVLGSTGNLGPIWVEALRDAGARVITLDLKPGEADYEFNCGSRDCCEALYDDFKRGAIYPDIIVNNAAIDNPPGSGTNFFTRAAEVVYTNLIGPLNVFEFLLPLMMRNGGGVVVNIGSIMGNVGADWRNYEEGFEKPVGYNLSKAGLIQLTRSIAVQYGRYNIRSVCIAFAACDTGKYKEPFASKFKACMPLGRFISRKSLQTALLFACCCPELTGQQVLIDGGYTAW